MSITSISSNQLPGASPRQATPDVTALEARQSRAAQNSDATPVQTVQSVAQTKQAETNRQQVEEAVKKVNDFLRPINNSIQFNLDEDSGRTIVKVIDLATKDVIRQFPSEEMLSIAKAIDTMKGLLVQQKA